MNYTFCISRRPVYTKFAITWTEDTIWFRQETISWIHGLLTTPTLGEHMIAVTSHYETITIIIPTDQTVARITFDMHGNEVRVSCESAPAFANTLEMQKGFHRQSQEDLDYQIFRKTATCHCQQLIPAEQKNQDVKKHRTRM